MRPPDLTGERPRRGGRQRRSRHSTTPIRRASSPMRRLTAIYAPKQRRGDGVDGPDDVAPTLLLDRERHHERTGLDVSSGAWCRSRLPASASRRHADRDRRRRSRGAADGRRRDVEAWSVRAHQRRRRRCGHDPKSHEPARATTTAARTAAGHAAAHGRRFADRGRHDRARTTCSCSMTCAVALGVDLDQARARDDRLRHPRRRRGDSPTAEAEELRRRRHPLRRRRG